ncbi:MAG: N-formylglutamate amidohydrolase [Burkholderiaceae bacterium]
MIKIERPTGDTSPLVLDSPHSGFMYPDDFNYVLDTRVLRRSEDAHIQDLFLPAVGFGATLIHALFPRCYIDPNRALEDLDTAMLDGPWPDPVNPSRKVERGAGLIWRQVKNRGLIYDRRLSVDEVKRRIDSCWRPYHEAVARILEETAARHRGFIHLNCHSMASMGDPTTEDGPKPRPDMILGDRDGTSCDPAITEVVRDLLQKQGYQVAVNDPYKGVELVRRYSDPAKSRHSLQIEINRALYMDEDSQEKLAGYSKLRDNLETLCEQLHGLGRELVADKS